MCRLPLSHRTLLTLLNGQTPQTVSNPRIGLAYFKWMWADGKRQAAFTELKAFVAQVSRAARYRHVPASARFHFGDGRRRFAAMTRRCARAATTSSATGSSR